MISGFWTDTEPPVLLRPSRN